MHMADHPNAAFFRGMYDAIAKGDAEALPDMLDANVVWHLPGNRQISGEHKGRDAVFAIFAKTAELSGGSVTMEVHDVLANDEHAVALLRESADFRGRRYDCPIADIVHMRGGKITELWSLIEDQGAFDAFWS